MNEKEESEIFPGFQIPSVLRQRFKKAIQGVYETEAEALRDLIRRFADSRGV